jgi:hypothetical protein|uniref:Uncharacterized protein n=1 Tax=viral metagenome TaxID=1070528 RepID=A0A6C0D312_9ZZZZ
MSNINLGIYVVFHNMVFEHLYEEMSPNDKNLITLYGVKNRIDTSMNIIYEMDLPIYNSNLQKNIYNEGSAFYHIYKNSELYRKYDYIGFGQYDMKMFSHSIQNIENIIKKDRNPIIVMEFFPDIKQTGFLGCHNLIRATLNDIECGLLSYNRFFNKNFKPEDVILNRLIQCNTFVISTKLFEKMMSWLMSYYIDNVNINRHPLIGNAGEIPEALIGMFLSLEVFQGSTYYKFDIEHVWPLYKNIANS